MSIIIRGPPSIALAMVTLPEQNRHHHLLERANRGAQCCSPALIVDDVE
jgi:hypothetical protein